MKSFQFSLRMMLAAVAVVAVTVAVVIAKPTWQSGLGLVLLSMFYTALFLTGALTADQARRVMFVGALIPAVACLALIVAHISAFLFKFTGWENEMAHLRGLLSEMGRHYRLISGFLWGSMPFFGAICGLLNWLFFSSGRRP
jgi:hypothetical protein